LGLGFTRQPDDIRRQLTRSRIDYVFLDGDVPTAAVTGAWLGAWGKRFVLESDHRPLIVALHTEAWLGSAQAPPPGPDAAVESAWPPRYWFFQNAQDEARAAEDEAAKRLPRQLPRKAFIEALTLPAVQAAGEAYRTSLATPDLSAQWEAYLAWGSAIKEALRPRIRPRGNIGTPPAHPVGAPCQARSRIRGLVRWLRCVRKHGDTMFYEGSSQAAKLRVEPIPGELVDLWYTAADLYTHSQRAASDTQKQREIWQAARAAGQELDGAQTVRRAALPKHTQPHQYNKVDWLIALLRIRIGTARGALRRAAVTAKTTSQWSRRLLVAAEMAAGRTGAVFQLAQPRTRPIAVAGTMIDGQWRTDPESIRRGASTHCAETVALTPQRWKRGTAISFDARIRGEVQPHRRAPHLAKLREVMQERRPLLRSADLVQDWTTESLAAATQYGHDTAPGPSGLTYWMISLLPPSASSLLVGMMNNFQRMRFVPPAVRHGYLYPIPKLGEGGATFEGARQIVLLEVTLKLISGQIAANANRLWEELGYLHAAQNGFRQGCSADAVAAFVTALYDSYRSRGRSIFSVAADVTKAFQSVGLADVEDALCRLGIPPDVIELWMQTDRGAWIPP
jgi:hypothetical protein